MNKLSIITISVVAIGIMGIAHGENAFSSNFFNSWTGIYAGVQTGFSVDHVQLKSQHLGFASPGENCNTSSDDASFFPGIHLGYLYQFRNDLVAGIELNGSVQQKDKLTCHSFINPNVYDSFTFQNKLQSSVKGRVGHALQWRKKIFLPYITTGVSFAKVKLAYNNEGGDHYIQNDVKLGWLIGTGIELSLCQNWSLRSEYYYSDYGNTIKINIPSVYGLVDPNGKAAVKLSAHNVVIAISYWME